MCLLISGRRRVGTMWASLVAALVSAFCYGIAAVMQAVAIRSASRRPARIQEGDPAAARVDPGLIVRLLGQWRFVASIGIDLIGFLAQLVALHRLPLFAVQAVIASNLAVTAVFAAWLMQRPARLAGVAGGQRGGRRGRPARLLGRCRGRGDGGHAVPDRADGGRGRRGVARYGRGQAVRLGPHPRARRDRGARVRGTRGRGPDPARLLARPSWCAARPRTRWRRPGSCRS